MEESKSIARLNKVVRVVERYIIKTLIGLMTLLLVLATVQLGYFVFKSLFESQAFIIDLDTIMDLFGVFLLVLIGIELLDTIKVYFRKHDIHVEVVLLVALIAIARKVILMDFEKYTGLEVVGIAAVIIALALGYYFIKKAGGCGFWPTERESIKDIIIEEKEFDPGNHKKISERKKTLKEKSATMMEDPMQDNPLQDKKEKSVVRKRKDDTTQD